jgi:hypothetical protein
MTAEPEPQLQPDQSPEQSTVEAEVTVRRIPKYSRFLVLGAGLGAIVTFILTASFPADPVVGFGPLFGYFLIYGVPAGVVFGALVALGLDLVFKRRARTGTAERTIVEPLRFDGAEPVFRADATAEEPRA